jgi:four helix bundle protein
MASRFRDLRAYTLPAALADELYELVGRWPAFDRWSVGMQMIRAADSVAANIAEAIGRQGPADQRRLLVVARGSLYELEHWIARADARGLLAARDMDSKVEEVAKTLSGLIRALGPT